jgi:hypothetical protein
MLPRLEAHVRRSPRNTAIENDCHQQVRPGYAAHGPSVAGHDCCPTDLLFGLVLPGPMAIGVVSDFDGALLQCLHKVDIAQRLNIYATDLRNASAQLRRPCRPRRSMDTVHSSPKVEIVDMWHVAADNIHWLGSAGRSRSV